MAHAAPGEFLDADTALKATAAYIGLNGLGASFASDQFAEAWGCKAAKGDAYFKFAGAAMLSATAAVVGALRGESAVTTVGYAAGVLTLYGADTASASASASAPASEPTSASASASASNNM